jgi:putative FmdB family regulatory protein
MPVYEFVCRDCQKPFEIIRPMSEAQATDVKCPASASGRVDRTYSHVYAKTSKKS